MLQRLHHVFFHKHLIDAESQINDGSDNIHAQKQNDHRRQRSIDGFIAGEMIDDKEEKRSQKRHTDRSEQSAGSDSPPLIIAKRQQPVKDAETHEQHGNLRQ